MIISHFLAQVNVANFEPFGTKTNLTGSQFGWKFIQSELVHVHQRTKVIVHNGESIRFPTIS